MTRKLHTLNGPVETGDLGLVLPHEHLFTDLRGPQAPGYAQAEPGRVTQVVAPFLAEAAALGVTALVECSTVGVGCNLEVLGHLAESTPIRIVAPTGVYRYAFIPDPLREMSEADLVELWTLPRALPGGSLAISPQPRRHRRALPRERYKVG